MFSKLSTWRLRRSAKFELYFNCIGNTHSHKRSEKYRRHAAHELFFITTFVCKSNGIIYKKMNKIMLLFVMSVPIIGLLWICSDTKVTKGTFFHS